MDRLRRETGDTDIRRLFNVASVSRVAAKRTTGAEENCTTWIVPDGSSGSGGTTRGPEEAGAGAG